ncbi:MAG: thiol reductant ABC exporter subunit CydD [Anaerolineales bacterium]|nr:thiol reductant ABC exporter subunit CydD [Anaerolineales bacterium]
MLERRLLALAPVSRRYLYASVIVGTLAGWAAIGLAWLLSRAIAAVFLDGAALPQVLPLLVAAAAVTGLRAAAAWLSEAAGQAAATRVKQAARTRLVQHLFALGPAFLSRRRVGELTATAGDGIDALDPFVGQFLPQRRLGLIVPLGIVAVVLLVDPISALILAATGPLIPLFLWLVGDASARQTRRQWRTLGRLSAQFLDALQGLATLKAFGRSRDQARRIQASSESFRQATMRLLRVAFLSSLTLEWLATISTALVAVQVGVRLLYADLTFTAAMFVLLLAPEFYLPLRTLGTRFHAGTTGREAANAVFQLLDEPLPLRRSAPHASRTAVHKPAALSFDQVGFGYPSQPRPALSGLTLQVPPGTRLAVLGPSGAGKTTLAYLALGLLQPTAGWIEFEGRRADTLEPAEWRQRVSWLSQTPSLLEGTIEDNLQFARPGCSREALRAAARQAGAEAFIASLPEGYDTRVGAAGIRLSAGEVKRIGLTRAFLRDAPLWILDEPTALLDADLEAHVRDSLEALPADRTLILIAHRLAGLPPCDQVLVLADGTPVECGQPSLLAKSGRIYPQLVAAYDQG